MESVGELHDDDADIFRHSEEHFAEIFEVVFLARTAEADLAEFGDAIDEPSHFVAELFSNGFERYGGVLGDIVKNTGGDGTRFHTEFGENLTD